MKISIFELTEWVWPQEEREQLNEFKSEMSSLNKRAKSIVQLKPRNPTSPCRGKLPIQAVCDFKQMEVETRCHTRSHCACAVLNPCFSWQITVHKRDECALINNSQPFRWKVLNRSGNEAVVPSICFLVPPVNKEAVENVSRYITLTTLSCFLEHFKLTLLCAVYQQRRTTIGVYKI